jgi:hypothetical protein
MTQHPDTNSRSQRRVVCAAIAHDGLIVAGPRHYDQTMHGQISMMEPEIRHSLRRLAEQGFIDQWGVFMSREEAFEVAKEAGQIRQKTGNPNSVQLFSEDLY